ncbi:hypothetical protein Tco_0561379 [Tanacetum coccineum]
MFPPLLIKYRFLTHWVYSWVLDLKHEVTQWRERWFNSHCNYGCTRCDVEDDAASFIDIEIVRYQAHWGICQHERIPEGSWCVRRSDGLELSGMIIVDVSVVRMRKLTKMVYGCLD